jgi:hypothetical protein
VTAALVVPRRLVSIGELLRVRDSGRLFRWGCHEEARMRKVLLRFNALIFKGVLL